MNEALALPVLALTSASMLPCLSVQSRIIGSLWVVLTLRTLVFSLLMLRPTCDEVSDSTLVFSCICCWLRDSKARSLVKSRSSSCVECPLDPISTLCCCGLHYPIDSEEEEEWGQVNSLAWPLVVTWKLWVSCLPWITLQVILLSEFVIMLTNFSWIFFSNKID